MSIPSVNYICKVFSEQKGKETERVNNKLFPGWFDTRRIWWQLFIHLVAYTSAFKKLYPLFFFFMKRIDFMVLIENKFTR